MEATANLVQPTAWDPLDLTAESLPAVSVGANDDGPGILPDNESRPDLPAVRGPLSEAPAPWDD